MNTDEKEIKMISTMNEWELLSYVITNPEFLTDSYYSKFGNAIRKRYKQYAKLHKLDH